MKLITIAMFLAVLFISGLAYPEREPRDEAFRKNR